MKIVLVVPFYNEAELIDAFMKTIMAAVSAWPNEVHVIAVDDGSSDQTPALLDQLAGQYSKLEVIHLAYNCGHQIALVAGLDRADGDAVITMDGDGQHPIEVASEMLRAWEANRQLDIIQSVRKGPQAGFLKNLTSRLFYWTMARQLPDMEIIPGISDFRLMSRQALTIFNAHPDRHKNIRLLIASLPLAKRYMEYRVGQRLAGTSKFSLQKMIQLATDGVFCFSKMPLRVSLSFFLVSACVGLGYLGYAIIAKIQNTVIPGWTSLMVVMCLLFTFVFAVQAIMAEYLARIIEIVKKHPVYFQK